MNVTAVVDGKSTLSHFVGVPVASSFEAVAGSCDAILITDLQRTAELTEQASALFGPERVLTPKLILPPPRVPNGRQVMTEVMTEQSWHVVQVHVHAEAKAQMHLARQGFETYLPRYLKRRRHARRTDTVAAPLYPSYLFVTFNPADSPLAIDSLDRRCRAPGL